MVISNIIVPKHDPLESIRVIPLESRVIVPGEVIVPNTRITVPEDFDEPYGAFAEDVAGYPVDVTRSNGIYSVEGLRDTLFKKAGRLAGSGFGKALATVMALLYVGGGVAGCSSGGDTKYQPPGVFEFTDGFCDGNKPTSVEAIRQDPDNFIIHIGQRPFFQDEGHNPLESHYLWSENIVPFYMGLLSMGNDSLVRDLLTPTGLAMYEHVPSVLRIFSELGYPHKTDSEICGIIDYYNSAIPSGLPLEEVVIHFPNANLSNNLTKGNTRLDHLEAISPDDSVRVEELAYDELYTVNNPYDNSSVLVGRIIMSEQKKSDLYVLDTTGPTSRTSIGPFHAITPDKGGFRGAILDDGGNAFVFKMQYYSAPGMKGGFL